MNLILAAQRKNIRAYRNHIALVVGESEVWLIHLVSATGSMADNGPDHFEFSSRHNISTFAKCDFDFVAFSAVNIRVATATDIPPSSLLTPSRPFSRKTSTNRAPSECASNSVSKNIRFRSPKWDAFKSSTQRFREFSNRTA
jgi:hypothetical protein